MSEKVAVFRKEHFNAAHKLFCADWSDAENKRVFGACSNPNYQLGIGKQVIAVDPQYFRPTEVDLLIGDPTKSKTKLGWVPQYDLAGLVKEMITSDVARVKKEIMLKKNGFRA